MCQKAMTHGNGHYYGSAYFKFYGTSKNLQNTWSFLALYAYIESKPKHYMA